MGRINFCWCCSILLRQYLKLRRKLSFVPHIPTLILSTIFWWFYQVYACGYLAFVEESFMLQCIYGVLVCGGITMTAASVYATTLQRYPIRPSKFAVPLNYFALEQEERDRIFNETVENSGANKYHVSKVCFTCSIIKTERSHHCAICDICTPRMDHHCVALCKCIHYKNQKTFTLFFFWMCFSSLFGIISLNPYFMRARVDNQFKLFTPFGIISNFITSYTWFYSHYLGVSAFSANYALRSLAVVCLVLTSILAYFLLAIFSFVFCNFMWFCNIRNGTIIACNKAIRFGGKFGIMPFFVDSRTRCFRKPTLKENLYVIFGKDWRLWIWPAPSNEGSGWLHDCSCDKLANTI